jgi:hypothetical protein
MSLEFVPAVVEAICRLFLLWGGITTFGQFSWDWKFVLIGNMIVLGGVLLGMQHWRSPQFLEQRTTISIITSSRY